jgi:hypothetical protein
MSRWLFFPGAGGGFVPTDISGIVGWWDPSDSSTVTLSGSAVTAITNKVSGGSSMVTYVLSPDIATANLNGKDVLDFTRTEGLHTNTSLTTSSDVTVIMVAQLEDPPTAGASTTLISNSDSAPSNNQYRLACAYGGTSQLIDYLSGTGQYYINGNTTAFVGGSSGPNDRDDLKALIADSTGWNIIAIADLNFATWSNDFRVMRYFEGSTSYSCEGLLADVIVYPSTLSTLDRQKVEGYVAHKYALQSKLPIGHPYKSTAP